MTNTDKRFICYSTSCKGSIDGGEFATVEAAQRHELAYHNGAMTCWDDESLNVNQDLYPSSDGIRGAQ